MLLSLRPLLAIVIPFCSATLLIISIPPSTHLPNPSTLPPSTRATLLSGSAAAPPLSAPLTGRSTLEFHNLTLPPSALAPQSYLLTISALTHIFASYRVDIIPGGSSTGDAVIEGVWETYPGSAWSDKGPILGGKAAQGGGASGSVANSPSSKEAEQEQVVQLEAKVLARRDFYEERAGFNPLGLLMNPMVLLGAVAMAITFGMPYLMDNLDPELKAEFEDQQKNGPLSGMHSAIQAATGGGSAPGGGTAGASNFDLAGWMAGSGKSGQGVATSGAEVREGGVRRR